LPSPDGSGNPFSFFFKKKKITTYSRKQLLKTYKLRIAKKITILCTRNLK